MPYACYHPTTGALLGTYRTPSAVYAALSALSAAQKTAIWTDLTSGSPQKWTANDGPRAASILLAVGLVLNGTFTAAQLTDMKLRAVAAYVLDNPLYLVNPSFDPSISIPGYA